MRQQQEQLQKRLKDEVDKKAKLEVQAYFHVSFSRSDNSLYLVKICTQLKMLR